MPDLANPVSLPLQNNNAFDKGAPNVRQQRNQSVIPQSVSELSPSRVADPRQDNDPLRNDNDFLSARRITALLQQANEEAAAQRKRQEQDASEEREQESESRDRARLFNDENFTLEANNTGVSVDDAQVLGAMDQQPSNSSIRPGAMVDDSAAIMTRGDLPPVTVYSQPPERTATEQADARRGDTDLPSLDTMPTLVLWPNNTSTASDTSNAASRSSVAGAQDSAPQAAERDRQPLDLPNTATTPVTEPQAQANNDPVRARVEEANPRSNAEVQRQASERPASRQTAEAEGLSPENQLQDMRDLNPNLDLDVETPPEVSSEAVGLSMMEREANERGTVIEFPATPSERETRSEQTEQAPPVNRQVERNTDAESVNAFTRAEEQNAPPEGLMNNPTTGLSMPEGNRRDDNADDSASGVEDEAARNNAGEAAGNNAGEAAGNNAGEAASNTPGRVSEEREPVQISLPSNINSARDDANNDVRLTFQPEQMASNDNNRPVSVDPSVVTISPSTRAPADERLNDRSVGQNSDAERGDVRLRLIGREVEQDTLAPQELLEPPSADGAPTTLNVANASTTANTSDTTSTVTPSAASGNSTITIVSPADQAVAAENPNDPAVRRQERDQSQLVSANNTLQEGDQQREARRQQQSEAELVTQMPPSDQGNVGTRLGDEQSSSTLRQVAV